MKIIADKNNLVCLAQTAADFFARGEIILAPFDTVYGFICDPTNETALKKIFKLKSRPLTKTIGLAVSKYETLSKYANISPHQTHFIKNHTLYNHTYILQSKTANLVSLLCIQNDTIAVRIPNSILIKEIINNCAGIVAQTSANKSGLNNCYGINDVYAQFSISELRDVLIIDSGVIKSSGPSQIVDLTGNSPVLIER